MLFRSTLREHSSTATATNRTERSFADKQAPMGIATTRSELRAAAAFGLIEQAPVKFETSHNVCHAGVIYLVPALLAQGLLKKGERLQKDTMKHLKVM